MDPNISNNGRNTLELDVSLQLSHFKSNEFQIKCKAHLGVHFFFALEEPGQ